MMGRSSSTQTRPPVKADYALVTPNRAWISRKLYDWRERYGKVNEHNGWVPRDFWLKEWEKQAIVEFHLKNPLEGYRRLTFMMLMPTLSRSARPASSASLSRPDCLPWKGKPSKKGTGFVQPLAAISTGMSMFQLSQHRRHVLLPVLHSGRL